MPNHETRTRTVLSTMGHIIRLSSAITGTRHWKKKSPLNKCTYITHSLLLSFSFLSFPPPSQVQQQLRASPCAASCHADPALSLGPLLPSALLLSLPPPRLQCSQPHTSIHILFSFSSLCIQGGEINPLYTCHFLQNFDLLCLQPLTSFPSLPPAWTVNTPVWYFFFLPWYKTRVGVCFKFSLISSISKHPVRSSAARADGLIPPGGLRHSTRSEGAAQGAQLRAHPITLQGRLASGSRCIYIHSSCSSQMSSASHLHDPEVGRVPASFPAPNPLTVCSSQYDNTEQAGARRGSKKPHRQH